MTSRIKDNLLEELLERIINSQDWSYSKSQAITGAADELELRKGCALMFSFFF